MPTTSVALRSSITGKMPPSLPQVSIRSIPSAIKPPTALNGSVPRAFSTSSVRLNTHIPPESPKFIKVPTPPQSAEVKKPWQKGTLPVARDIFHKRAGGAGKVAAGYVERTAPRSAAEAAGQAPRSDVDAWKRSMAESRRQSLAAGLQGLWKRKQRRERLAGAKAQANFERNRAAALAPEGQDDVLTRSSVRLHTSQNTAVAPDPERPAKIAESAARTAALLAAKSEARKDALQQLYIAAGDFIVTEAELEAKINELFDEKYWERQGSQRGFFGSENAWDAYGPPIQVRNMLDELNRTQQRAMDFNTTDLSRTAKRQKTVTEELTGGKME